MNWTAGTCRWESQVSIDAISTQNPMISSRYKILLKFSEVDHFGRIFVEFLKYPFKEVLRVYLVAKGGSQVEQTTDIRISAQCLIPLMNQIGNQD